MAGDAEDRDLLIEFTQLWYPMRMKVWTMIQMITWLAMNFSNSSTVIYETYLFNDVMQNHRTVGPLIGWYKRRCGPRIFWAKIRPTHCWRNYWLRPILIPGNGYALTVEIPLTYSNKKDLWKTNRMASLVRDEKAVLLYARQLFRFRNTDMLSLRTFLCLGVDETNWAIRKPLRESRIKK